MALRVQIGVALGAFLAASQASAAAGSSVERGRVILQTRCAVCHAVTTKGASPNREAPPFRLLHDRYPIEMLAEALAEGILTGHPSMPQFQFQPRQIDDIIAYLNSIQTTEPAKSALPSGRVGVVGPAWRLKGLALAAYAAR